MCIYCDRVVKTNLKEIDKTYIEDTICESDCMGIYRKFTYKFQKYIKYKKILNHGISAYYRIR